MVNFRRWLARKLDPEILQQEKELWFLRKQIYDLRWWCAEFPIVAEAAIWLSSTTNSYMRPLGTAANPKAVNIDNFREDLRRRYKHCQK